MFHDWAQLDRSAAILQASLNEHAGCVTWLVWDADTMRERGYTEPEELVVNCTYGDEFVASMTVSVMATQVYSTLALVKHIVSRFAYALGKFLVGGKEHGIP